MTGWHIHTGPVAVLPHENVDTDQLIPARFMSAPRSAGYGQFLLHDHPDRARIAGAEILIAGRNFGSGSSREAAVYALVDAGIRAVIAPGFGDIFAANAVNNGLLPATVTPEDAAALMRHSGPLTVDLVAQTVNGTPFTLPETWRQKLLNGWDDIDLTASHTAEIKAFSTTYHGKNPWSLPNPKGDNPCE